MFNRGVIRGRILSMKIRKTEKSKLEYGDLRVFCSSQEYGDLTVRLRFWGAKLKELQEAHKEQSTGSYWFDGDLGMLKTRDEEVFMFNAYKFKPWVKGTDDEPRASFIIEGRVTACFETFEIHYNKPHPQFPKDFIFKFPAIEDAWGVDIHDRVVVYGHFKDKHIKHGGSGEIIPIVEEVKIKQKKGG